jgi:hypothetical protein
MSSLALKASRARSRARPKPPEAATDTAA